MELLGTGTPMMWGGFLAFVLLMLGLDLGVFHRKAHVVSFREALGWSLLWVFLSLCFSALIHHWLGSTAALEFLTGYVVEKSLAIDNIFVFVMVFSTFQVPAVLQHRVLFWGIFGALLLRAFFILLGAALLAQFHWLLYVFGAFLLYTGFRMLLNKGAEEDIQDSRILKLVRRFIPVTPGFREDHFFVREKSRWLATPLFLVLLLVEAVDLIFAVDSIPAIFAITQDPFIVFTSNIFAILGLRSMYFLLADLVPRFVYLKTGLSLVLVFVGTKMLLMDIYKLPIALSLGAVAILVLGSVLASPLRPADRPQPEVE